MKFWRQRKERSPNNEAWEEANAEWKKVKARADAADAEYATKQAKFTAQDATKKTRDDRKGNEAAAATKKQAYDKRNQDMAAADASQKKLGGELTTLTSAEATAKKAYDADSGNGTKKAAYDSAKSAREAKLTALNGKNGEINAFKNAKQAEDVANLKAADDNAKASQGRDKQAFEAK